MTTEVLTTGAVFEITDRFSAGLDKLVGGLSKAETSSKALQAQLDKLGLGAVITKMKGEWTEIGAMADKGVAGIVGKFDTLGRDVTPGLTGFNASVDKAMSAVVASSGAIEGQVVANFDKMGTAATKELTAAVDAASPTMFGAVLTSAVKMQADVIAEFTSTGTEVVKALSVSIDAAAPTAFAPLVDAAKAASGEMVTALGSLDGAIAGPLAAMRALTGEMTAAAGLMERVSAGSAAVAAAGATIPNAHIGQRGGHGRGGGPHFGRVGTEIPGGHASVGGGPALAGAGIIGYGIYEAAEMRDEVNKLLITGQVNATEWGGKRDQLSKLLMDSASLTGFSVGQVGEALSKSERAMSGLDVNTKMDVTKALNPYAAAEARLKDTSLAESLEAMVGLAHMTGTYEPGAIADLARKFSYVSLSTNASLPRFENTLSYSMPLLRSQMGMNPDTIMALTAVAQNAGITSTKSGTWLRSFFEGSEPMTGDSKAAQKHNGALYDMGLLDNHNRVTWKKYGEDGKVDWNASVANEAKVIASHLAKLPIDDRAGTVKQIWGERGGGMASMLSMQTFVEQFSTLSEKIKNFKGGESALEEYAKDNPAQKARETWRDFQNVLMNIGDKALPTVNSALSNLDEALKRLPADWEATKKMWGFRVGAVENAAGVAADKLKDGAGVLGKMPGPLGAPFRDQSKPAFDPNSTFFVPSAYTSDVVNPDQGSGSGMGSMIDALAKGVYGGVKMFAADTGGMLPVSVREMVAGMGGAEGWGVGGAAGGMGHGGAPSIRYGRQHSFGGGSGAVAPFHLEGTQAKQLDDGIRLAAQHLGIDPKDLATTISYETAGTMDPWKAGPHTKWGWHHGLIQWGEPQAKQYGVGPNSTIGEQMAAVEHYLRDAGVRSGMGIKDVYSAINAGHVGKYGASDGYGTVSSHVDNMLGSAHRTALDRLDAAGAGAATSPALRAAVPGFALPKGGYWAKDGKGNAVPVGPDGAAIQSYRPAPTVDGRRTVAPGKPAAGTSAMNVTLHSHTHLDGRVVASNTSHHMVEAMEHPNASAALTLTASWQGPATPLNDAA